MLRETCAALAGAPLLLLVVAGSAAAAPPKVIEGDAQLGGEHLFSEVIVRPGATLRVRPAAESAPDAEGAGWLHLKAGRIVVEAGGTIDATGAGYPGADGANGAQPEETSGGGLMPLTQGRPGTGGAHAGPGSSGVGADCVFVGETPGGKSYPDPLSLLAAGSAGGAFSAIDPSAGAPSRGGHGGGRVLLEAAAIEISGQVLARGGDGIAFKELSSGGGAGGFVQIVTAALSGTGVVSVTGGRGGTGTAYHGGGGGGGLVLLRAPGASKGALSVELRGGASGPCTSAVGSDGLESLQESSGCPDTDGDTHTAASCGGDDCDDGDPAIHPGATDATCDGEDNDCNGTIDDALSAAACPDMHSCQAGECVPLGEGGGGGGGAGGIAPPDHLEYRGGCALAAVPEGESGPSAGALGGAGVAGVAGALLGLGLIGRYARRRRVVTRAKLP